MFERESRLNEFLLGYFKNVVQDIPAAEITQRAAGGGHPPVWILGHLAICPELGETYCGVEWKHPLWKERFGPGSPDDVPDADSFSKDQLVDAIVQGYPRMVQTASAADPSLFEKPHGLALLDGTPIKTRGDLVAHLLTSHFAFHLAQLSGWRRSAGHGPLF
jgi:hypothetical protein